MLSRSDSPSHTLSATTRVRSLCQPLAHTHGLALRATNLIFSGSFLLCNNLHPSLLPASSSGLVCHSLPALSTPFTDALCPANKHTTQSTHIPNHVSSTEFSCLHAVLHLSHSECECCPAATPQVIVTHSLSETTPAHSFASLWLTLMALHSLQTNFLWLLPSMQQPAPATFRSVYRSHSSCPLCSIHLYPLSYQQKQCHSGHG